MAKKKSSNGSQKAQSAAKKPAPSKAQPDKSGGKNVWLIAAAIVVVVAAVYGLSKIGPGNKAGAGAPPEEAKYMGRLLPKAYAEPKVADFVAYSNETPMSDTQATVAGNELTIPLADVTSKKLVYAQYTPAGGSKPLPLIAYVKPSGKLFVGVSFCAPCESEKQIIEPDQTLTCASCGTKRNIETQVGISGACKLYPIDELPATVAGGKITVDKSVLDKWTPQPKDRQVG
jgi:hypothetical protein